jgi:uncharacterized protein
LAVYLDASFIVPLFIADSLTERSKNALREISDSLLVSDWAVLEVSNVVAKSARIGAISQSDAATLMQDFDEWRNEAAFPALVQTIDISTAITFVRRHDLALRGPDAARIAIAQRLGASLLTFDKGMATAAAAIGLDLAYQSLV